LQGIVKGDEMKLTKDQDKFLKEMTAIITPSDEELRDMELQSRTHKRHRRPDVDWDMHKDLNRN